MSSDATNRSNSLSDPLKYMEALVDEALQLYELDTEKTNIVDELYNSLKVITNFLGVAVDLHPTILNLPTETKITLSSSLDVLIIKPNGKSEQKSLDMFSLDDIISILQYAIPTIINIIRSERTQMNEKITSLRAATKQLRELHELNGKKETTSPLAIEEIRS
ncbi:MAG: hypothetical protein HY295_05670 [Thaumarchaeota archaeon]|nr:hypothetical protein [Nitrososphaerota archaeon]